MNYLIEQIRDSNSLQHHGIKGMHWGVRKQVQRIGAKRRRRREVAEEASKMSDQELRQRLNRLQMEEQYKRMAGPQQRNSYPKRLIAGTATGIIGTMAMNGAKYAARGAIKKSGHEEWADILLPKKGKNNSK